MDGASGSSWYTFKGTDSIDAASISYPASANAGDAVTVTVTSGTENQFGGAVTYRFEYSTDGGGTWHTAAQTKNTKIAELTVEAISPEQVSQISGYLDTWESVSFDDKRRVVDLMITTVAATSDSLNITWKI